MRTFLLALVSVLALGLSEAGAATKTPKALLIEQAVAKYGTEPCKACKEIASFHNPKTGKDLYHAMHRDLPLGTLLLIERAGKRTVVVVHTIHGKAVNISSAAAEMLGMKTIGVATVSYSVIAWPKQEISATQKNKPDYVKGLTKEQVNRILSGEDAGAVIPDVYSVGTAPEGTVEEKKPPLVITPIEPNNDSKRNFDSEVLASIEFASRIFGALNNLDKEKIDLIRETLVGVCGTESKCNPTTVHYMPNGGISPYQGIGQMGWAEARRSHKTLKDMAELLPTGELQDQLRLLVSYFDGILEKTSAPKKFVGDPRFEPSYGPLLFMAFHAEAASGKNLPLALLRKFPAKDVLGQPVFYKITPQGVAADTYGTIPAVQLYVAIVQLGQLSPTKLVDDAGMVDLEADLLLTSGEINSNKQLLLQWVVKPKEGAGDDGVLMPNSKPPKTKGEAIARIIKNSEARYHVSRAAQSDAHRRAQWTHFMGKTDEYAAAWQAFLNDPNDAELGQTYLVAERDLAEAGWAVRSLLFDPGKTVYDKSARAESFREYLAKFRVMHYKGNAKLKFSEKMNQQWKLVESMRLLAEEQVDPDFGKKKFEVGYPVPNHLFAGMDFAIPPASQAETDNRAEFLITQLKLKNPDSTDTQLAAQLVFRGLEGSAVFKKIQEALAIALVDGKVKSKTANKDALVRANSEIGKAVAELMKTEGPLVSFSPKCINVISKECVLEDYLWTVDLRVPIKIDSSGYFAWKDITGALNDDMGLRDYVIGGTSESIKLALYFAGKAMDAEGVPWTILSAYRGLMRPGTEGAKAALPIDSKHYNGGYGKGIAIDIGGVVRIPPKERYESNQLVWNWLLKNGKKYGLRTHLVPGEPWHIQPGFDKASIEIRKEQEAEIKRIVAEMNKQKCTTLLCL